MKHWETTLAVFAALSASLAVADDFKTINGKEYKNAEVSRIEPDGIVLRSKSGISKVYFTELPKDVQERFHYNPAQATAVPRPAQATAAPRQRERKQIALRAEQDARRQADQRIRQLHTPVATPDFSPLFLLVVVIATLVVATSIIVTVVRAKQRRELRDRLFNQRTALYSFRISSSVKLMSKILRSS